MTKAISIQIALKRQFGVAPRGASASPATCSNKSTSAGHPSFSLIHLHLPAPLRSPGITRLQRYYEGSDSCAPPIACRASRRSLRLTCLAFKAFRLQPPHRFPGLLSHPTLQHPGLSRSSQVWASPFGRRLANRSGRIEFVILRTTSSPSVALHPASRRRSFSQIQAGVGMPERDFHPPSQTRSRTHDRAHPCALMIERIHMSV